MNMFWLCDYNNFIRIYSILVVVLQIKFVYGYNPLKGRSIHTYFDVWAWILNRLHNTKN